MSAAASGGVFISYRRQESSALAGRLYDRLAARFGADQVFMDVGTVPLGVDFVEVITQAVSTCEVLLAVISPRWLTTSDEGGRRLNDPDDFVRLEIAAALERNIRDPDSGRGRGDAAPPGATRQPGGIGAPPRIDPAA